jgi:hypothetical protein
MKRWGVLDQVSHRLSSYRYTLDFGFSPDRKPQPRVPGRLRTRRTVLDKILVDAADDAGADARELTRMRY